MRTAVAAVLLLLLAGVSCKRNEGSVLDVVHQTLEEARTKPRLQVDILSEGAYPSPAELQRGQSIETRIEREHIGRVVGGGSGPGFVRIVVEVDETVNSIEKLRALLRAAGVMDRASVKIVQR